MGEFDVLGVDARRELLRVDRLVEQDLSLVVRPCTVGNQFVALGLREPAVRQGVPLDAVDVIANDRVSKGGQVDVDLVVTAGNARQSDPGDRLALEEFPAHDLELGDAVLGALQDFFAHVRRGQIHQRPLVVVRRDPHVGRAPVVPHDRQVDDPFVVLDMPRHEGLVPTIDLALPKDLVELADGIFRFGHDDQPRGVHSQPVDDHVVAGRQVLSFDVVVDGFRERRVVFLARDRQDARRFVDDQNILVLVNDDKILLLFCV